jgi:signal transduction histidine kinase
MTEIKWQAKLNRYLNTWPEQVWRLVGGVSVRTKILGIVLALTVVLGLGITWEVRLVMQRNLNNELERLGHSVLSDLVARSAAPLQGQDWAGLQRLLRETVANHPDSRYAFIVGTEGQLLAHTFADQVPAALISLDPASLSQLNQPANYDHEISPDGRSHHFHYENIEGTIHDFAAPILPERPEVVRLGLAETRLQAIIAQATWRMLLTTLVVGLIGILAAMLLTWLLTRPISDLVIATQRLRERDLSVRVPHWADDEIGVLADAFNQMTAELEVSHQAIAEKEAARTRLLAQLIEAQEEERKRIARELHDGVGQALTSVLVGLKVLNQLGEPGEVQDKVSELRQVASETLDEVRILSRQLRPSALDDLGLVAAIERYIDEFLRLHPGLPVDFHANLAQRLVSPVETTLYRIIQEAMTNAARHSQATALSVLLSQRESHVQAIIEDNGHGFDPAAAYRDGRSVGLHSMVERAELLGGRFDIESGAEGTTVYVELPL